MADGTTKRLGAVQRAWLREVAARGGRWSGASGFYCGSPARTRAVTEALEARGLLARGQRADHLSPPAGDSPADPIPEWAVTPAGRAALAATPEPAALRAENAGLRKANASLTRVAADAFKALDMAAALRAENARLGTVNAALAAAVEALVSAQAGWADNGGQLTHATRLATDALALNAKGK